MKIKVLILGGSGFIGKNFLNILSTSKYNITATYFKNKPLKRKNIKFIKIDLANNKRIHKHLSKFDWVICSAGNLFTHLSLKKNSFGPIFNNNSIYMNILNSIYKEKNNIKKFLFISTSTGYPSSTLKMSEKYFFQKEPGVFLSGWLNRYIEKLIEHFSKISQNNIKTIIIRPSAVFGKFDDFNFDTCHALPAIIRRFSEKQNPLVIYGNGYNFKNWIFVEDLVKICIRLLSGTKNKFLVTNVCNDKSYSLRELALKLSRLTNFYPKIKYTDLRNKKKIISKLSNVKLKTIIGGSFRFDLDLSLKKTYNWYKNNYER